MEQRIYSRHIVTPEGLVGGEAVVRHGVIVAVEARQFPSAQAVDWSGDWLIPGLIDIHTDNLEKHYQPRPGALWDAYGAAAPFWFGGVMGIAASIAFWRGLRGN